MCDCFAMASIGREHCATMEFFDAADTLLASSGRVFVLRPKITRSDIADAVLAAFAADDMRRNTLARVRSLGMSPNGEDWDRLMSRALHLVDDAAPKDAFGFRATAILIAGAIEDEVELRSQLM